MINMYVYKLRSFFLVDAQSSTRDENIAGLGVVLTPDRPVRTWPVPVQG